MLDDYLTNYLFEKKTMLPWFYFLGRFGEDPTFELDVSLSIDHVYLSQKRVEVSEVADLL